MKHFEANSPHARDIATLIHPNTNIRKHQEMGPTIISRGEGIYVFDDSGRPFLDAAAGLWCASLGFSSDRLAKVASDAIKKLGYYHLYRHTSNEASIDLAEKLIALAPVPMSKVLLQCSGSEANDTAIKLVWYHWNAVGKPEKRKIIGRLGAYHGSSVAAISIAGKPEFHAGFGLPLPGFLHTDFPHYYRMRQDGETEQQFSSRMAQSLEDLILAEGPETVAAFWAEPVMGAGGAILPPAGYFEKIQAVLRRYDILFVADEVICGFGRTGNMWGSQTYDLQPDMISCAKALSAAFQPISAVLINQRICDSMLLQADQQGSFFHGYTYAGHPVAAAVALEVLKIYDEIDIVEHVRRVGPVLQEVVGELADHPLVGNYSGVGLIGGLDLVKDKATRDMYPPDAGLAAKLEANAQRHGLVLRLVRNRIALSPPLVITESEIQEMGERLRSTLDDTWNELKSY
ncbi:aminotransferase [Belnapia rosea]|uniref:aminotransferase n=1 Tax=Belnapia rosea TaxID=938405 RepID=UPI0008864C1A|nr:aminotransferase [Belnapia rosea]SDB74072.1 4-aminobutyrate---pyruvate transaminase [Belnapia rosea]